MALGAAKIHRALLALLLLGYFDYSIWSLYSAPAAIYVLETLFAGIAAVGTLFGRPMVKYLVSAIAIMLSVEWLSSVWLSMRIGYFAHQAPLRDLVILAPGIAMLCICAYGCYVAWKYVGSPSGGA